MKLLIAVVQRIDAGDLIDALTAAGHALTRISSEGGFLHEGNVTLLIGVEDQRVEEVVDVIRRSCHTRTRYVSPLPPAGTGDFFPTAPIEVQVGGATVFVINIEGYQRM